MDSVEITLWSIYVCSLAFLVGVLVAGAWSYKQQGGTK